MLRPRTARRRNIRHASFHGTALRLEPSADSRHASYGVTGLTCCRRCSPGAFVDWADSGSEIAARPEGIHMHGKYRTGLERLRSNALLRHRRGTRHLDAPIDQLPVFVFLEFAVGPD